MGGGVKGIILDHSVLLVQEDDDHGESLLLQPGADSLARRLRHSGIRTGISYGPGISAHKVGFLKKMAKQYSFDCFIVNASSINDAIHEIMLAWGDAGRSVLYVASNKDKNIFLKPSQCGWLIMLLRSLGPKSTNDVEDGGACKNTSTLYINKLEEIPLTICCLNRKEVGKDIVIVGYIMKPSREEDFAKRGAFPMYPSQNGLIFMPLTFELPLSSQIKEVDVILHKATDEIISIELSSSSSLSNKITFTRGMQELERYIEHQPDCCVIDPLNNIYPVLDRLEIQKILLGLECLNKAGFRTIRGAHFLKVDNFSEPDFLPRLSEAKLSLPCIVKPQVACGVTEAHSMAIVFRLDDFRDLSVPLPAIVQEYVDHSSTLYKFYVLGEEVFHAVKNSTPNADILIKLSESKGLKPLLFDSLKSLPTANENQHSGHDVCSNANNQSIDLGLVRDAANWLNKMLNLTVFGFDVVIQEGTGDHVIVDVNYLPSFKEVPDDIAVHAFWDAIKKKVESKKMKQETLASFSA